MNDTRSRWLVAFSVLLVLGGPGSLYNLYAVVRLPRLAEGATAPAVVAGEIAPVAPDLFAYLLVVALGQCAIGAFETLYGWRVLQREPAALGPAGRVVLVSLVYALGVSVANLFFVPEDRALVLLAALVGLALNVWGINLLRAERERIAAGGSP